MAIKTGKDVHDDYISDQSNEAKKSNSNNPLNENSPRNTNNLLNFLGDVYTDNEYQGKSAAIDGKYKRNKELFNPDSDFYKGGGANRRGAYDFRYGIELVGDGDGRGHEDPTILGFDIVINTITSPLFSGSEAVKRGESMGDFLTTFSNAPNTIPEIAEKIDLYHEFIYRISNYFQKVGSPNNSEKFMSNFKSHYIKKVAGLDKLTEKIHRYGDGTKQSIGDSKGWESDKITLTLYEDVELSSGYLAMLYKTLTWSKLNGKQLIPDNLLRFDMDIIISEIRNFNKVTNEVQNSEATDQSILNVVSSNVSRYIYRLYDCQFIFDNLSNTPEVDNWASGGVVSNANDLTVDIIYKFSTVDMERMDYKKLEADYKNYVSNRVMSTGKEQVDSDGKAVINLNSSSFQSGDINPVGGTIIPNRKSEPFKVYTSGTNQEAVISDEEGKKSGLEKLKADSKNFATKKATRMTNDLVNDTIGKVRRSAGLRGISAPQNVYDPPPDSLRGFVIGQVSDFGNSGFDSLLGGIK